jgi:signal transduction histidine kinase
MVRRPVGRWQSSSFVLGVGCGILVILIGVLGVGALRRARAIYQEMHATQDAYLNTEAFRRSIVNDMYLADILVRDYLMDPSPSNAPHHREDLRAIQEPLQARMDNLTAGLKDTDKRSIERLNAELQRYWDSLDPMFSWTPQEKADKSWYFLRRKVLPQRQAVIDVAREVARLSKENLDKERKRIEESEARYESFLTQVTLAIFLIGIVVAILTTRRVRVLERRHDDQTQQIAESQGNLRRLSRRLVQIQETERKSLSRELHDEVGQILTALGMELKNLESLRHDPGTFHGHIEELKALNAQAMRSLRDMAMGLRPSMLDDLGLEAALQWQGREFSRHTGVPATVQVTGVFENLSESQRTCIYRVVQEALTNCARHSRAKNVLVSVSESERGIVTVVHDDGVGFDVSNRSGGLGLIGTQERVDELGGEFNITSAHGKGTTVRVELPLEVAAA